MSDFRLPPAVVPAGPTLGCIQRRTFEILDVARAGDRASRVVDRFILGLIALNVVAEVVESIEPVRGAFGPALHVFDVASVGVFTIEYILRVWSCTVDERYRAPIRGRVRFALSPLGLIDLAAILPFYLPFMNVDLRVARTVRLVRLFRIAKFVRYSSAFGRLGRVLRSRREELVAALGCMSFLLLVASTLMFAVEGRVQPDHFSSIPATMWWSVSTLTTVGYGDVYPITGAGKLLGALVALVGMGFFALPAAILGSGFIEDVQEESRTSCPHCGVALDASPPSHGSVAA